MSFHAFEVSLQLIRFLRVPLARLAARHASLATQMKKAAASVSLNPSEGRR